MVCLDVTEQVIEEAIEKKCDVIISHYPLIFSGLKNIIADRFTDRLVIKDIKNDLSIISMHTNLDNIYNGVNRKISTILGLEDVKILDPQHGLLKKLVVFCPVEHADKVRMAIFDKGNYFDRLAYLYPCVLQVSLLQNDL